VAPEYGSVPLKFKVTVTHGDPMYVMYECVPHNYYSSTKPFLLPL
jgi:hypothetical protein